MTRSLKSLALITILSVVALPALSQEAQDPQSNFDLLALKIAEAHRDTAKWEQEIEALRRGIKIEREQANDGELIGYVVVPDSIAPIFGFGQVGGITVATIYGTTPIFGKHAVRRLLQKTRMQAALISIASLLVAVESKNVLETGEGLIFRLNSKEALAMVAAIKQAKIEIKLIQKRLAILEAELARDSRYQEAKEKILEMRDNYEVQSAEDLGRAQNYLEEFSGYNNLPKENFKYSTKEENINSED